MLFLLCRMLTHMGKFTGTSIEVQSTPQQLFQIFFYKSVYKGNYSGPVRSSFYSTLAILVNFPTQIRYHLMYFQCEASYLPSFYKLVYMRKFTSRTRILQQSIYFSIIISISIYLMYLQLSIEVYLFQNRNIHTGN